MGYLGGAPARVRVDHARRRARSVAPRRPPSLAGKQRVTRRGRDACATRVDAVCRRERRRLRLPAGRPLPPRAGRRQPGLAGFSRSAPAGGPEGRSLRRAAHFFRSLTAAVPSCTLQTFREIWSDRRHRVSTPRGASERDGGVRRSGGPGTRPFRPVFRREPGSGAAGDVAPSSAPSVARRLPGRDPLKSGPTRPSPLASSLIPLAVALGNAR